ncbi:hypothetical protein TTHERM_00093990 (macronuclear) [Tetrahymena thermophila SB210]|uniref:Uncharacterized protein n=1 Tax=Tetrahymena thermophila (strain SB210) TaxID=312017 RepID=Q235Z2_TETTS|nr:hypothetical protein TTHERM_00093990 [Tetrahymena thermophila SB210]EAR92608.2 hypothetical protein TTHERM_00093990 [Tetrahymena thermophila SB210]|eukprot:XP_001012853.2 hypothetical protein TTHERM_00093990 [Tetrahymena thermophila SB210]
MSVKKSVRRSLYGDSIGLQNFLQQDILKNSPRSLYQPSIDTQREESTQANSISAQSKRLNSIVKSKRSTSINIARGNSAYNSSEVDVNNYEKNTNNYQHLFTRNQSPTSCRDFAFSLRYPMNLKTIQGSQKKETSPPKCYEETINKKFVNADFQLPSERPQEFDHLIRKRVGPTIGHIQLGFEVGLRNYSRSPKEQSQEREWDPTQFKDNSNKTVFLPSIQQEIKLKKTLKRPAKRNIHLYKQYMKQFEIDALYLLLLLQQLLNKLTKSFDKSDGQQNYPQYTDKIVRSKNYNEMTPLKKYEKDGDKPINQLKWELNLNNYSNKPKQTFTDKENE